MRNLIYYLDCGKVNKKNLKKIIQNILNFELKNLKTLIKIFIPLVINYPIVGQNLLDFLDLCKVANLMEQKAQLTIEGLNQIELINKTKQNKQKTKRF